MQNLLKNWTIVKSQHTITDNIFTFKFYNRSIYFNFLTNIAKLDLLSVNLSCYALVKRRQHMRVWCPHIKEFELGDFQISSMRREIWKHATFSHFTFLLIIDHMSSVLSIIFIIFFERLILYFFLHFITKYKKLNFVA